MYKHPHADPQRPMEYSLAGIWLLCLLLTAMEWFTPVEVVKLIRIAWAVSRVGARDKRAGD